ncbi:hypothetical protein N0V82_003411 [Gnomoniopsis sp. IMI 355080]|nr:hypothetical protein N0V82_003411 [Gnomoniopsis sp. IMI 355080]
MAPPQIQSARRDMPKHRIASRVHKTHRLLGTLRDAKPTLKHSHDESTKATRISLKAFDDEAKYQTHNHTCRPGDTNSLASYSALNLDGASDLICMANSEDKIDKEVECQMPGPHARLSLPGFRSTHQLNMDSMPTEILQMIWREALMLPACHTFKVKRGVPSEEGSRWTVHLWPKEGHDTSAYNFWKRLLSLKNIGFQTAFRLFAKQIQPLQLRATEAPNGYKLMAAIDADQDLVILEMDRGQPLPWFEHSRAFQWHYGMDSRVIRHRMRHFRKVAIHYKFGQIDCAHGGAFACLCHGANQPHDGYNACPLTLASFLDLLPNLEKFYFVVETKLVWHKKFAAEYRNEVAKNDFRARIEHSVDPIAAKKQYTLARFFDTKYEYLQQAPLKFLEPMGRADSAKAETVKGRTKKPPSPWIGDGSAWQCMDETRRFYKSQKGNESFLQPAEKRRKVRFGLLIPYSLEEKKDEVTK